MIRLLVVGDGERDQAVVPALVRVVLAKEVEAAFRPWARLHEKGGRGYARKLRYAASVARDEAREALVAVIDVDTSPRRERWADLQAAREAGRSDIHRVPTAIGAADPHGEAWLLDDPAAVRSVLALDASVPVLNVAKVKSPKQELESLLSASPRRNDRPRDVWGEIAGQVRRERCAHAEATGFRAFWDDVRRELGSLG